MGHVAAAGSTMASVVCGPVSRGLSQCGFCLFPLWMSLPLRLWSAGLLLREISTSGSGVGGPVTRFANRSGASGFLEGSGQVTGEVLRKARLALNGSQEGLKPSHRAASWSMTGTAVP